jgi:deoxyribonuclease-4
MAECAIFGVAGNPPNFWKSDFRKERADSPKWLHSIGLDALEIQCTYGVKMPEERANAFRENANKYGIRLSIHAPYYITIGSSKTKTIDNSLNELKKASELAYKIGSDRVIFHPGSIEGDRQTARKNAIESLRRFEEGTDLKGVCLFPEIAGKIGAFGSLEDILLICEKVECAWPCLDLAHLHAREHGSLRTKDDFAKVIDTVEERLGAEALKHLHVHLYPVKWGDGGEVTHKAFHDKLPKNRQLSFFTDEQNHDIFYGPRYEPFLELVTERSLYPTVICEARDSQDIGSLEMKRFYTNLLNKTQGNGESVFSPEISGEKLPSR